MTIRQRGNPLLALDNFMYTPHLGATTVESVERTAMITVQNLMVVCIDPKKLPVLFAGRAFDRAFVADLPASVDPCGENGEFHTCVTAGPMFAGPVPVRPGETVERDGFAFADLVLDQTAALAEP